MIPCALTIAGSDSGGGAGVQADLKTFAALRVHGLSAFTALTAQSTVEVRAIHAVPAAFVATQIETVLDDFDVRVAKTGMMWSPETMLVVAQLIEKRGLVTVVDPVMIAESGASLLPDAAVPALIEHLLPRARLLTPNLPEIARLSGIDPQNEAEMIEAGRRVLRLGPQAVLVKGGHARFAPVDILIEAGGEVTRFPGERIDTTSTHGTGCTYAAAITALLAHGHPLRDSVGRAHVYLVEAIRHAPRRPVLGHGKGPVHHFHPFYSWLDADPERDEAAGASCDLE